MERHLAVAKDNKATGKNAEQSRLVVGAKQYLKPCIGKINLPLLDVGAD